MRTVGRLGWVEIKLLLREPLTLVFSLALPLILLFVLGSVFGNTPSARGQKLVYRSVGARDYYLPAYVALVIASVCVISVPAQLAGYRERGVLKHYRASSVSAPVIGGAELMVAVALSAVSATILGVAAAMAYSFERPESVFAVVRTFLYLSVGFVAFGLLLGALLPTARSAQAGGMLIWFVMLFLGGAGPPPEVLSGPMHVVLDLTPMWYAVQMMQSAWLGLDPGWSWWVFTGVAVASAGLALRLFRWE